jgi:hypothetical protein
MTQPTEPTAGAEPAEGRTDLDIPGADVAGALSDSRDTAPPAPERVRDIFNGPVDEPLPPTDPGRPEDPRPLDTPPSNETERRDELADRVGSGTPSPAGRDAPDLGPSIDIPDVKM